jgi:hypothetical protein
VAGFALGNARRIDARPDAAIAMGVPGVSVPLANTASSSMTSARNVIASGDATDSRAMRKMIGGIANESLTASAYLPRSEECSTRDEM